MGGYRDIVSAQVGWCLYHQLQNTTVHKSVKKGNGGKGGNGVIPRHTGTVS